MDNKKLVLDAMKKANKPLKPGEISVLTGLEEKEVSKTINELKKSGEIHSPKRCFYAPTN
jgi:hypothetical protein